MPDGKSAVRSHHQRTGCAIDSRHKLFQDRLCRSDRSLSSGQPIADFLGHGNPYNPFSDSSHRDSATLIVGIDPATDDRRIPNASG